MPNRLRFGARFPEALDVAKRRIAEEALVVAHELRGTLVAHPVRRRRDVHFARQEHSARLEEPHALSELQGRKPRHLPEMPVEGGVRHVCARGERLDRAGVGIVRADPGHGVENGVAFRSRAGERAERSAAGRVEKQGVEIAQKERRPKRNEGGALEEPQEKKESFGEVFVGSNV